MSILRKIFKKKEGGKNEIKKKKICMPTETPTRDDKQNKCDLTRDLKEFLIYILDLRLIQRERKSVRE